MSSIHGNSPPLSLSSCVVVVVLRYAVLSLTLPDVCEVKRESAYLYMFKSIVNEETKKETDRQTDIHKTVSEVW